MPSLSAQSWRWDQRLTAMHGYFWREQLKHARRCGRLKLDKLSYALRTVTPCVEDTSVSDSISSSQVCSVHVGCCFEETRHQEAHARPRRPAAGVVDTEMLKEVEFRLEQIRIVEHGSFT